MLVVPRDRRFEPPGHGPVVAALGYFDGLHRGHRTIVEAVAKRAAQVGGTGVMLTFDPHPLEVIAPGQSPRMLLTRRQKAALLDHCGLEALVYLPFDRKMAGWSPGHFVRQVLVEQVRVHEVFIGMDFRFGHRRAGGVEDLDRLGRGLGFLATAVPAVLDHGRRISASWVRAALVEGAVEEAQRLLGRPYALEGRIVRGAGRGRKLTFPTANLEPLGELVPARGVYVSETYHGEERLLGLTNVGVRPTFGEEELTVETFLPGFEGDLYGARVEVAFHARVREERTFPSPEALQEQIREDLSVYEKFASSRRGH